MEEYARVVLKVRNSQLVKTNGFGAILRAFPRIFEIAGEKSSNFLKLIEKQVGRVNWIKPEGAGTGTGYQKNLLDQILKIYD